MIKPYAPKENYEQKVQDDKDFQIIVKDTDQQISGNVYKVVYKVPL